MRLSAFHTTHNTLSIRILATDLHLSRLSCFSWQLFSAHLNNAFGKSNDFIFIFPYRCDSRVLSYMYEGLIIHVSRSYHTCMKVLSYMYEGLHVKSSLFLSDFIEIVGSRRILEKLAIQNFTKIRPVGVGFYTRIQRDGQTDGLDEANSCYSDRKMSGPPTWLLGVRISTVHSCKGSVVKARTCDRIVTKFVKLLRNVPRSLYKILIPLILLDLIINIINITLGTGSFPEVKRLGCGVNHPPHLAPRLKKEQRYTSTPPLGLRGLSCGELYHFYLYLYN